jgi:hypothetical protein
MRIRIRADPDPDQSMLSLAKLLTGTGAKILKRSGTWINKNSFFFIFHRCWVLIQGCEIKADL